MNSSPLRNAVNAQPFAFNPSAASVYGVQPPVPASAVAGTLLSGAGAQMPRSPAKAGPYTGSSTGLRFSSALFESCQIIYKENPLASLRGSTLITPNPFSQLSHDTLVGAAAVAQEHCDKVGARLHVSAVASDTLGVPAALLLTFEPGKHSCHSSDPCFFAFFVSTRTDS